MFRALIADPLRLLARKALPRLMAFAAMPTRGEIRRMVERAFDEMTVDLDFPRGEFVVPKEHHTLH